MIKARNQNKKKFTMQFINCFLSVFLAIPRICNRQVYVENIFGLVRNFQNIFMLLGGNATQMAHIKTRGMIRGKNDKYKVWLRYSSPHSRALCWTVDVSQFFPLVCFPMMVFILFLLVVKKLIIWTNLYKRNVIAQASPTLCILLNSPCRRERWKPGKQWTVCFVAWKFASQMALQERSDLQSAKQ